MPTPEDNPHFFHVDCYGRPLQAGAVYGVRLSNEPETRAIVWRVLIVLRGYAHLSRGTGRVCTRRVSNLEACGLIFTPLDPALRPIEFEPAEDDEPEADPRERLRAAIAAAAVDAAKLRRRQARLMARVIAAAGGDVSEDFRDALASMVRDESSHVTADDLLELADPCEGV